MSGSGLAFKDYKSPKSQKSPQPKASGKRKVLVLSGPTGVGKTALSLRLAQAIGGEIVSADSMQVYRGMDIGTAKATPAERRAVIHHLIDARDLDESFNVVDFYEEGMQAIRETFSRDHVPIVVGGTGFYIHALLYGPPGGPPSVPELRTRLEWEMEHRGPEVLYEQLCQLDPDYAVTITANDRQKIIRALEIIALTRTKVSQIKNKQKDEEYDFRCWFIYMPKQILYPRIETRCDQMVEAGLLDEVKRLEQEGLRKNLSAAQAIGYRQGLEYLSSEKTHDDMGKFIEAFKQASRRYAKRQFTWFRKEPLFRWLDIHEVGQETALEIILQDFEFSK